MLPSADKLYGDADFTFQQDLAPAHTAKVTKSWFNDHGITVFDWPANSPDQNPIENLMGYYQEEDERLFSEAWHFCLKYPFLLILCNIQIFWDTEFGVFIICKP